MTKNKIKRLYKKTLKRKWDLPLKDIRLFYKCPFCDDAVSRDNDITNDIYGTQCGSVCLIDKKICGSDSSFMAKMADYLDQNDAYPPDYDKYIVKMVEKVRKALRKHT